jgi:SOS response regulatory protein OraA/RecX
MSETVVEIRPRPRDRLSIRLSGGRSFTVPQSEGILVETGMVLGDDEVERLSRVDQYLRGKDKALRMLAIRARSRHEIEAALAGMEIAPAVRAGVLEELREMGLVDDGRFAREYAASRVELKHMGPHRIKFELGKLGVSAAIVDKVLKESFPSGRQEEIAWTVVRRKIGSRALDEKDIRRTCDLLKRKGFDYGVINGVAYELLRRRGEGLDAIETTNDE